MAGASCCRCSSTRTPISTRAISGRARPIRPATSRARSTTVARGSRGATGARATSPRAWSSACAAAYAHGTSRDPHPYRQRRPADAHQLAGRSPRRASAGAAGSTCRPRPLFAIDLALDAAHMAGHRGDGRRARLGILGAVTYMVPELREASTLCSRSPSARAGTSISMSTRPPIPTARSLARDRRDRARARAFAGRILVGHCCSLARQDDETRARTIDARRARRDQRRLAADVQYVPAGPRTPAARRAGAASPRCMNCKRAGRQRDDRQRQHARSLLRLWRSRHAGGLARGRAHPASRLSLRRLGAGGLRRRAREGDGRSMRRRFAVGARADMILTRARDFTELFARPQSGPDRAARRRGARRPRRRPMPNSTPWRASRHESRLRHRGVPPARSARSSARTIPVLVKQKSRDFYWYSPVLKRELDAVTADIVVTPTSEAEVATVLAAAHELGIPGHAARRRHRQLRPGDAADRRRAAEPGRDEQGPVDPARPRRLRARRDPRSTSTRRAAASGPGTADVPLDPRRPPRSAASSPAARAASARSPGAACAISATCCACAC